jgi:four helix bundle protein
MKNTAKAQDSRHDPLGTKSYEFAVRIVNLVRGVQRKHREYVLSKQVMRSGTAIGALVREAEFAQSRADFANTMPIALKEANETKYWLSPAQMEAITSHLHDNNRPVQPLNDGDLLLISDEATP